MNEKYIESYRKLGLNINYYRRSKDYTQSQLADILNIDITHMGKIELCKVGASLDVIFSIAEALEVPVHKLFEFRD